MILLLRRSLSRAPPLPNYESTTINAKNSRKERGTTWGHVSATEADDMTPNLSENQETVATARPKAKFAAQKFDLLSQNRSCCHLASAEVIDHEYLKKSTNLLENPLTKFQICSLSKNDERQLGNNTMTTSPINQSPRAFRKDS